MTPAATHTLHVSTHGDRDVVLVRRFNAPKDRVFDAYTTPALLKRWLTGMPGWWLDVADVDLRVGGAYRFVWKNDQGISMGMGGRYLEIARPNRLVCTEQFDDPWYEGEAQSRIELVEADGVTTLTNTLTYSSRAARDGVIASPMESGVAYSYDQLDALVRT